MMMRKTNRPLAKQKLIGAAILAVCAVILLFGIRGKTLMESDCTPILVFIPVGLALLVTKHDVFEDIFDE